MAAKVIRKYESSFGQWYVQVELDGSMVELSFDHDPAQEEIDAVVEKLTAVPESIVELEAEDGTLA